MSDRFFRKASAAREIGISYCTLWRAEKLGLIRAVCLPNGIAGFFQSEIDRFLSSAAPSKPDAARTAAATASPLHGRPRARSGKVADA